MPSLVIDARMIDASGIGVYLKNLIPFLTTDYQVTLLGDPSKVEAFAWAKQVQTIKVGSPIYSFKEQLAVKAAIPACDVFWSPHYNIPLLPIKAKRRVVTIHDTYHLAYKHTLSLAQKAFASVFLNAAVKRSNEVITVSAFSKNEIVRYTRAHQDKIEVIHNGVDSNLYKTVEKSLARQELRRHLPDLPASFILYVGNVKPHKNLKTLLKAYSALPASLKDQYKLVIAGKKDGFLTPDSSLTNAYTQDTSLHSQIFFTGYVADEILPLLYNCASLFVFPSVYEGFGLPPLEAMACGCPVVASTAASIPEVCGKAALYFGPFDWKALQEQIEKALTQEPLKEELLSLGYQQSAFYTWSRSAEAHKVVFQKQLASL